MTDQIQTRLDTGKARIVAAPSAAPHSIPNAPRHQIEIDRHFELPTVLFGATVAAYLAFLGIMLATFAAPALAIPMVIFAGFIVAGFGVPAIWVRLKGNTSRPMTLGRFRLDGIMTHTGRCSARDASVQMLLLPGLVVAWGCAIAVIAAVVA
ncbi:MAG: hypothetical protein V2I27_15075 [Erythrobacter sp.]|jgi:hypothetical protein|nr:hypothetical protein [Erythrobacter sp.]